MAFQRPFLISLKRGDSSQRWGFSIRGGREYGEPLQIQSVCEDSVAEKSGLHDGDEVIQVGRVNVQDLTLDQAHEVLARCGNKIEMFVIREDLLSPRKGKEPPVVKAVVHNPYNSPLSLYSTENVAETLAQQTEVLTEGHLSNEEDEGPENLSFKQKSAVFQLLEEQAKHENPGQIKNGYQSAQVRKPKAPPPPPPPKPKPPSSEPLYNGYGSHQQTYQQDQQWSASQTSRVLNQYQYQREEPVQYQQTTVYKTSSHQTTPGYQSPGYQESINYQTYQGPQSPTSNYQPSYQQVNQSNFPQSPQGYQSPAASTKTQQHPGYQSPTTSPAYQQLNQTQQHRQESLSRQQSYQQQQQSTQQSRPQQHTQQVNYQQTQQSTRHQKAPQSPGTTVTKEVRFAPEPPIRGTPRRPDEGNMAAVYKQQYEQHLQRQNEQQQQNMYMNSYDDDDLRPRAHIIEGDIFEHNSMSGTPITYKAPPAAPPKPNWPPSPQQNGFYRNHMPDSPTDRANVAAQAWPPKKSTVTELPKTGFNPAAVREQGEGRRCVWPPPSEEFRSGRNTPQSPSTGRRIQWNPSPSPPLSRRTIVSPSRRKDIQWPPPSDNSFNGKENMARYSPRMSRKARFDDYIHQHASINVPQTYRPPPGTQHIEYH